MTRAWASALLISLALVRPGWAQTPARVEIGGGVGIAGAFGVGGGPASPTLSARVNITRRLGLEVATDLFPSSPGLTGLYRLQAHHAVGRALGLVTAFVSYGALGTFESRHQPERRQLIRETGDTVIYPAHRYGRISRPYAVIGGGGARVKLATHLVFETGGDLWFGMWGL